MTRWWILEYILINLGWCPLCCWGKKEVWVFRGCWQHNGCSSALFQTGLLFDENFISFYRILCCCFMMILKFLIMSGIWAIAPNGTIHQSGSLFLYSLLLTIFSCLILQKLPIRAPSSKPLNRSIDLFTLIIHLYKYIELEVN